MHILLTVLYMIPKVLTRRIWLLIKSFFHWWSFPLFSWPWCMIQEWFCNEKLDAGHSKGLKGWRKEGSYKKKMKSTVAAKNHIDLIKFVYIFCFHCIFMKFFCFQVCYFLWFSITFFAQFTYVCIIQISSLR